MAATIAIAIASLVAVAIFAGAALLAYAVVWPLQPYRHRLPHLSSEDAAVAGRLRDHVAAIASVPHNIDHFAALEAAACYIERQLVTMGHRPQSQDFSVAGWPVRNIAITLEPEAGAQPTSGGGPPSVLIGAHYDSPDDSPGANDNGTGVAALIEIARTFADNPPANARLTIVFFVNEEAPWGKTEHMGSLVHARSLVAAGERLDGMIALETLGYFSEARGSQKFPFPFGLVYPDVGNFVAFVGLPRARSFVHRALRAFRAETQFPSIGGIAPGFLKGIDLSDHWAYDRCGFPAMMITDTAPFRNPHYHTVGDLPHTVDYDSLARITNGLTRMLRRL